MSEDPDWRTEAEIERDERREAKKAERLANPPDTNAHQQIGADRAKHRFERPFRMPTVKCVCGRQTIVPVDMGIIRQRDAALDWFNQHLLDVRAARRLARTQK